MAIHSDDRSNADMHSVPSTNGTAAAKSIPRASPTGIKVIIVGAGRFAPFIPYQLANTSTGFGGLTAAIECHRQGHDVEIYESFKELKVLGDIISFGANAGRIFSRWQYASGERISERLRPLCIDLTSHGFNIYKYDGTFIYNQATPPQDPEAPVLNGHRGELHSVLFNYAKDDLGIPIHLGHRIRKYFEDDKAAGIVLEDGTELRADVVIGSDGVRSKARELVLGYEDKPTPSGYAVFRAW